MFPGYISPRKDKAPHVTISKNAKYPLVKPTIPKGVHVADEILPNLKKMGIVDHDMLKFPKLAMSQYMTSVRENEDETIHLVPME